MKNIDMTVNIDGEDIKAYGTITSRGELMWMTDPISQRTMNYLEVKEGDAFTREGSPFPFIALHRWDAENIISTCEEKMEEANQDDVVWFGSRKDGKDINGEENPAGSMRGISHERVYDYLGGIVYPIIYDEHGNEVRKSFFTF